MNANHGYPPLAEQSCGNCRYYCRHSSADWPDEDLCLIRAPDFTAEGMMPRCSICRWCGEWAPGELQR